MCLFSFTNANSQQTLTQINGWNAYVHLPANYATSGITYPTIIFFPGLGEVGTNAAAVISNGPGAYIAQGWNGNVVVDGSTVEFIVISLQTPTAYPTESVMDQRIQTIKSLYRVNTSRLYLTGLSHGGWCSSTFVTGDPYGGPYYYASQIAAVVTVEGVIPDDNTPYPDLFDNFAFSGGKYLGFEQIYDGRDTKRVVDRMNAAVPNSGVHVLTNFGGGGHCCWSEFYGGGGTQPGNFLLGNVTQNLYQWLARQYKGSVPPPPANILPFANAGTDLIITLPNSYVTLNGTGSDADGTIASYQWSQVSGPSSGIFSNPSAASTTVSALVQGSYTFQLKVTDNVGGTKTDDVIVTVNGAIQTLSTGCNSNAPVTYMLTQTGPGEIYRPNSSLWKGGDTIKITGTSYSVIEFYNVAGDACRPLVIMPATTVSTPVFRFKGNSRYIKLWGGKTQYGIKVNGGPLAITSCNHIEVDNVETTGGSNGVYCKQDVDYADPMTWSPNYRMTKLTFKNMWIHDVHGEGMYIGITQPDGLTVRSTYSGLDTVIVPIRLDSVEISNNLLERCDWDGIQLSNARNGNKIFNNTIRNYGTINMSSQQAGLILGGNCNGDIYNNTITQGTGNGIQAFGYGVVNIYGNTLDSCGYDGKTNSNGTEGQQSIYASDFLNNIEVNPKQTINAYNNNVKHPKSSGAIFITDYYNNSLASSVYNNIFCIPNAASTWQNLYLKLNVPGSSNSNNTLSCTGTSTNVAPVANAGADITISLPTTIATLNGSATLGTAPYSYAWTSVSGPNTPTIVSPLSASTNITGMIAGTYYYRLTIKDNAVLTSTDDVMITVNSATGTSTNLSIASTSATIATGTVAALTSSSTNSNIVSTTWTKLANPAVTPKKIVFIGSSTTAGYGLGSRDSAYAQLVLRYYGAMGMLSDTVWNNVNLAQTGTDLFEGQPSWYKPTGSQRAPLAGKNVTAALALNPNILIVCYPTNSYDFLSIPEIMQGYRRIKASVDSAGAICFITTTQPRTTFSPSEQTKLVTIRDSIIAQFPNNYIEFYKPYAVTNGMTFKPEYALGDGVHGNGLGQAQLFERFKEANVFKGFATSPAIITTPNTANTTITSASAGINKYQVSIVNDAGLSASSISTVTVGTVSNVNPIANAGANQSIILPASSATLNGTGTVAGGTIASYLWSVISGPAGSTFSNATSASTIINGLVLGTYQLQLKVTDNLGATATAVTQIIVSAATVASGKSIRVNVFGGSNPVTDTRWNNWGINTSMTSSNFLYEDRIASTVSAALTGDLLVVDNGSSYASTSTITLPSVLRYNSASTSFRTLTLNGLDPAKKYSFELYASRNNTGNKTLVTIGSAIDTISTDNNINDYAKFSNVTPDSKGVVAVRLERIGGYNYLAGFSITEQSSAVAAFTASANTISATDAVVTPQVTQGETLVEMASNSVSVYPNPFSGSFKVQIKNKTAGQYALVLSSPSGQTVYSKKVTKPGGSIIETINVSNLSAGTYILQIISVATGNKTIHKVIKN